MNLELFTERQDAYGKARSRRESRTEWVAHCARRIAVPEPTAWDWQVLRQALAQLDDSERECADLLAAMKHAMEDDS